MKIKKYFKGFTFLLFLLLANVAFSQNVGISTSSSFTPDASAALDVSNTSKGLLIPRVALTAINVAGPISSPATSLLVYNTATAGTSPNNVIPGYYYWTGSIWVNLINSTQNANTSWLTTGNSGTSYNTNFLGNTDNAPLRFRTNNTQRAILDSLGNFGIGSEAFDPTNPEKLLITAGTTTSTNLVNANGSINNYLQFNVQNLSSGAAASTDIVATANNGTEAAGYIDMGINSSGYTTNGGVTGKANTAYIYSAAADLVIGNGAANKNLVFFTNANSTSTTTTPNGTERMRIDGATGNVGIGTGNTTPAQKLDVVGSIRTTTGTITVDATAANTGNLTTALLFGSTSSGEGISSKRSSGNNQNGLDFYTSSNNRMSITNGGNVGIGTVNPRYPLEIATKTAYTTGTYNAYNNNTDGWTTNDGFSYYANGSTSSTANASTGGSGTYYSIVTAGRIAAKEFNAYSDKREKIVIGQSNSKSDLALLNQLKITDYTWIDKIGKSPVPEKKLIAQELRAVYPQAVKLIPGFIPNIYQKPIAIKFDPTKKSLLIDFPKAHNSIKGDLLRIYVSDKLYEVTVKDILSSSALTVNLSDLPDSTFYAKDIFVFGKKVNDYHTVDYDAVSMLNVSATQELYRQLEQQKEESRKVIDDLKKQLEDQNTRIKRLEEKFK